MEAYMRGDFILAPGLSSGRPPPLDIMILLAWREFVWVLLSTDAVGS